VFYLGQRGKKNKFNRLNKLFKGIKPLRALSNQHYSTKMNSNQRNKLLNLWAW